MSHPACGGGVWINIYTPQISHKEFFFLNKNIGVLLFLMEHYAIKINIIRYCLLQNSTALERKNMNL